MHKILLVFILTILISMKGYSTYPPYYSQFYKGYISLRGKTDTIQGNILLDPLSYNGVEKKMINNRKYKEYVVFYKIDSITNSKKYFFIKKSEIVFARLYYEVVYSHIENREEVLSLNYSYTRYESKEYQNKSRVSSCFCDYKSFIYHGDTLLLRQICSGKVDLYDNFMNPEKNITDSYALQWFLTPRYSGLDRKMNIFILQKENLERISTHTHWGLHLCRMHFMLEFMNKRYSTTFNCYHFKNNYQMFTYISDHG